MIHSRGPTGILLLDKPAGMSSNAALQRTRRLLRAEKAGHVGSLDPLATGMLPICLGEATKIAGDILAGRKLYRFAVALGTRTATGDTEGEVVETLSVPAFGEQHLTEVVRRFHGRQSQVPPMYSALKRDGQPLYKLARAGIEVERSPREIEIFQLDVVSASNEEIELEVLCSKGTYVRTLAEDLARALGTCGHVRALRRLYVEPFGSMSMETLESIAAAVDLGGGPAILPADAPLQHLEAVRLSEAQSGQVLRGQAAQVGDAADGRARLYDFAGRFIGIGEVTGGRVQPRRLFVQ